MPINVSHNMTRHAFTVEAPEGEWFAVQSSGEQIAVGRIDFEVVTDGSATLCKVGARYSAKGHLIREDGTLSRSKRNVQGVNLARVPVEARLALQEGIRESIGALRDPLGQLDGYDGRSTAPR